MAFLAQSLSPHVGPTLARKKAKSGATRPHHPCRLQVAGCRLVIPLGSRLPVKVPSHPVTFTSLPTLTPSSLSPSSRPSSLFPQPSWQDRIAIVICCYLLPRFFLAGPRSALQIACIAPQTEVRDTWTGVDSHRPRPFPHHSFKTGPLSPALARQTHSSFAANILAPFVSRRAHRGSCPVQEGRLLTTEQPVDRGHQRVVDVDLSFRPDASPRRPSRLPIPESEFGGLVPLTPAGIRNKSHPGHSCPDHQRPHGRPSFPLLFRPPPRHPRVERPWGPAQTLRCPLRPLLGIRKG